jgi:hypothetical protein
LYRIGEKQKILRDEWILPIRECGACSAIVGVKWSRRASAGGKLGGTADIPSQWNTWCFFYVVLFILWRKNNLIHNNAICQGGCS